MIWGERPSADTTDTQQLPRVPGTIPQRIVTDELLAGGPTQTVALDEYDVLAQPVKRRAGHRKPHPQVLTWRQTGAVAAALGALVFVAVLASAGPDARPAVAPHVGPAATATTRLTATKPKPTRPAVRRAEPVVLRSERPTRMAAPVRTVTVTVSPTATPTPKPPTSRPTPSVTPSPTSSATPVIPEADDPEPTPPAPEEAPTDTETFDDDD